MLELMLPVIMKYSKDGDDEFTFRTFTDSEEDLNDLITVFGNAAKASAENNREDEAICST